MNLLFDKNKIKELQDTQNQDLQDMISKILDKAAEALEIAEIEESYADDNDHLIGKQAQHGNYYEASKPFCKWMPYLGFAYHYTGEEKYFQKAKKLMLLYAGYKKWYGSGFFAKSELNNAHFCYGMACGYDMFYDRLSGDERKLILTETVNKGIHPILEDWIMPATRVHAMDTMGHNWWVVCIAMAGIAAVVMQEDMPELAKVYELVKDAVVAWFHYSGNQLNMKPATLDNGAYYEGLGYLDFSLSEYGLFKLAAKRLLREDIFDDEEILTQCSAFFCHTLYPTSASPQIAAFGDISSNILLPSSKILLGAQADLPMMRWYISRWKNQDVTIYDVVFYDEIYKGKFSEPKSLGICYKKIGWGILRTSFEDNSRMIAVKCGDTWNHAHADAASFFYFDRGEEIIGEGGSCGYGEKEYLDYFCASHAHNTVLFENKGQERRDIFNHTRLPGRLIDFFDENGFGYICTDATGPMARYFRRFLRHFVCLDDTVFIYDDIEAYEEGRAQFLIHEKKAGYFKMLSDCQKKVCIGIRDHCIDEIEEYSAFTQETDADMRVKYIAVIGENHDCTTLTKGQSSYVISNGKWSIYINVLSDGRMMHQNCINLLGGYETDAVLLALHNEKIFFVNASFIRKNGKPIFSRLERKTGTISLS